MVVIEDKGGTIRFRDGVELKIIPAHFLHSTGNFTLYDPISKILFSGDIGVSVFPKSRKRSWFL
jgi:flavorubredoxin